MINNKKLLNQIFSILFISVLVSVAYNQFRSEPLSLVKKKIQILTEVPSLDGMLLEPTITGININLAQTLFENNVIFIDARSEEYFNEGHIPNAICKDDFDSLVVQLENILGMDDPFVVYCSDDDCGSSEELSYELQSYGFNNIYLFKGGWKEWQNAGLPEGK